MKNKDIFTNENKLYIVKRLYFILFIFYFVLFVFMFLSDGRISDFN